MIKSFSDFWYVDSFRRYSRSKSKVVKNREKFWAIFWPSQIFGGGQCKNCTQFITPALRGVDWAKFREDTPTSPDVIRPPGTAVPDGLTFYRRCFYLFRHAFSELPRPIALKLCHMVGIWLYFIIPLQKFGGSAPPKKFGAKNMQNFGQFWTTSDFDREYLRNGWRYPKSAGVTNYGNSSCV